MTDTSMTVVLQKRIDDFAKTAEHLREKTEDLPNNDPQSLMADAIIQLGAILGDHISHTSSMNTKLDNLNVKVDSLNEAIRAMVLKVVLYVLCSLWASGLTVAGGYFLYSITRAS